jgi:hypothetical protein
MTSPLSHPPGSPRQTQPTPDTLNHRLLSPSESTEDASLVICKIEDILESIVDALSENRVLAIPIRSRLSGSERSIRFPSRNDAEAKKFGKFLCSFNRQKLARCLSDFTSISLLAALLLTLHMAHNALTSRSVITKRSELNFPWHIISRPFAYRATLRS